VPRFDNIKIVKFMIEKVATNWDYELYGACFRGNIEIVKLMIKHGTIDWNTEHAVEVYINN